MYYRFGSFLAPLSVGLITSRHYLSERNVTDNKNGRTNSSTTSNDERPEKVEVGKRLAEYNCKKREELKAQKSESKQVEPMLTSSQYSMCYGIGAFLAVGVIGGLGYYLYQAKKGEVNAVPNNPPQQPSHPCPKANKFEME